jgi:hypothetical protein
LVVCAATLLAPQTSWAKKKKRKAKVNLAPYQPSGWSDKIVITNPPNATSSSASDASSLMPTDTLYLNFVVLNNSAAKITFGLAARTCPIVDHYRKEMVDVTIASLDDPTPFAPRRAIWLEDKLPWVRIDEALPMFQENQLTLDTSAE